MVKTWGAIGIETEYCNHGKQSSNLVVAFFAPERAGRRLMVLVRKVKNGLEAVGRKAESQIPRMAGGAYAVGMMTALMCQTAYATDIFGVAKSAMQQESQSLVVSFKSLTFSIHTTTWLPCLKRIFLGFQHKRMFLLSCLSFPFLIVLRVNPCILSPFVPT